MYQIQKLIHYYNTTYVFMQNNNTKQIQRLLYRAKIYLLLKRFCYWIEKSKSFHLHNIEIKYVHFIQSFMLTRNAVKQVTQKLQSTILRNTYYSCIQQGLYEFKTLLSCSGTQKWLKINQNWPTPSSAPIHPHAYNFHLSHSSIESTIHFSHEPPTISMDFFFFNALHWYGWEWIIVKWMVHFSLAQ